MTLVGREANLTYRAAIRLRLPAEMTTNPLTPGAPRHLPHRNAKNHRTVVQFLIPLGFRPAFCLQLANMSSGQR